MAKLVSFVIFNLLVVIEELIAVKSGQNYVLARIRTVCRSIGLQQFIFSAFSATHAYVNCITPSIYFTPLGGHDNESNGVFGKLDANFP